MVKTHFMLSFPMNGSRFFAYISPSMLVSIVAALIVASVRPYQIQHVGSLGVDCFISPCRAKGGSLSAEKARDWSRYVSV